MSLGEISHRIREQGKRAVSRVRSPVFAGSYDGADLPRLPVQGGLASKIASQRSIEQWSDLAERASTGRHILLGLEWPGGEVDSNWHLDPVTHHYWPSDRYCFRIPYRHSREYGDVKYVWELNRLQYLQPIAALAALEDDLELKQLCVSHIDSWVSANPPFKGVNWASGIELASRVVSILVVLSVLGDGPFSSSRKERLIASLVAHGYWLMRYPSKFSSANNHLIAEGAGLYLLGCFLPDVEESRRWLGYGRKVLLEEAQRQLFEDGVGAEQSPTYTAYTLEWLVLCGEVSRHVGNPFPSVFWERLERAAEFLLWITDKNGHQPAIGDDDEGHVFFFDSDHGTYVTSIIGTVSAITERSDLAPPVVAPSLRDGFLPHASATAEGPTGMRCFGDGGYTVIRDEHNDTEIVLTFDHGPLGYLSIAAHGHADALSIWLHVDGQPVIVDAGTYLYHSGGTWRDHFRSTAAHSALSVEGVSSSVISGAFNWSEKARASLVCFDDSPENPKIEACHDGFVRRFGVTHTRTVQKTGSNVFIVADLLTGNSMARSVEIGFLFHPDLRVEARGKSWFMFHEGRCLLRLSQMSDTLFGSLQSGRTNPYRAWYSSGFGDKCATTRLTFEGKLQPGIPFLVELVITPPDLP